MNPVQSPVITDEFRKFVESNRQTDTSRLRLKYHNDPRAWIGDAITQIECMAKCRDKFGILQPELMVSPLSVEQATSASVAQMHAHIARQLLNGSAKPVLLDMTCGMGIDLKAIVMANPDAKAFGIERNPVLAAATAYNFRNFPEVTIYNCDSVEWLCQDDGTDLFDLVFIDPARRDDNGGKVFNIHHCQPDVAEIMPLLQRKCRNVMVKLSPMLDITQTLRDLPLTTDLHVIDDNGECREILAVMEFGRTQDAVPVIHIHSKGKTLDFSLTEERACHMKYAVPEAGQWLFEPYPATMKAAPFALLCERYGLEKLHANTNLFVSDSPREELPGRWYEIEQVCDYSSSVIKNLHKTIPNADIAVRNFPLKAEALQGRLKIKSGGNHRIIGVTTCRNDDSKQQKLLVMKK